MNMLLKIKIPSITAAMILTFVICSCGGENNVVIKKDTVVVTDTVRKHLVIEKQEISQPDYVPPKNGKSNKKWFGNRNRQLMNDRECYFGKGMKKRHRYRGGWNNR